MGERFLIGTKKGRVFQMSITKYTMSGESTNLKPEQVKTIGDSLGVDWNSIDATQLYEGTKVEAGEHQDVMNGNTEVAVKIALSHLKEIPDYYTRLKAMEAESGAEKIPNTDDNIKNAMVKGGPGSGRRPEGGIERESVSDFVTRGLAEAHILRVANAKLGKPAQMGYKPEEKKNLFGIYRRMLPSERAQFAKPGAYKNVKMSKGGPGSGRYPAGSGKPSAEQQQAYRKLEERKGALNAGYKRLMETNKPGLRFKGGNPDKLHGHLKELGYKGKRSSEQGGRVWDRGEPYTSSYSRIVHHPDGELYIS